MKISTFLIALVFIGAVFFTFALAINEGADKYGVDIDNTLWEGKYDYASEVNESVSPLIEEINKISDEENGWLEKVGAGFTGIISAVILIPTIVWKSFSITGTLVTDGFSAIYIPQYIIAVFLIMITIWGIFKLIEFFQGRPL